MVSFWTNFVVFFLPNNEKLKKMWIFSEKMWVSSASYIKISIYMEKLKIKNPGVPITKNGLDQNFILFPYKLCTLRYFHSSCVNCSQNLISFTSLHSSQQLNMGLRVGQG